METIFNFLMEHGYKVAIIFGVIWIALEIADYIRKKKRKAEQEKVSEIIPEILLQNRLKREEYARKAYEMGEDCDNE